MEKNRDLAHNLEKHQRENDLFEIEQAKKWLSQKLEVPLRNIKINVTRGKRITSMSLHGPADASPEVKQAAISRFEKRIKRIRQEQEEMDDRW